MSKRKETRKSTYIQLNKEFKRFKKITFSLFHKKYGDPYLYQYTKKTSSSTIIPKWKVPTQYHLNLISGLVNNKLSHYNSFYKEQQIFISDIEYILKCHSSLENQIIIGASYHPEKKLIPNFYPQGEQVMAIVNNYYKDIAKFPFQGRKAYFRYTLLPPQNMEIDVDQNEESSKKTISSFDKENDKVLSPSNSLYFLYQNNKNQEEQLNMTINDDSCFFTNSLLDKINEKSIDSNMSNSKDKAIVKLRNTSIDSIEQIIEEIKLLEEDRDAFQPTRKGNLLQKRLELKNKFLINPIRNELKLTNERNNKRFILKTRKEQLCLNLFNAFQQNHNNAQRKKTIEKYNFEYDFSSRAHHKHTELFLYGKASNQIKTQKKRNFMRSVLLGYNQIRLTKGNELKRKNLIGLQKQITIPKSVCLKTEERIQNSWLKFKDRTTPYQGLSNSRTLSHKYCNTIESEHIYCRTHNSILNTNGDNIKYRVENRTKNLLFKIQKTKDFLKNKQNKINNEMRTKQTSMLTIACCPDIYENFGMKRKKVIK